MAAQGKVHVHVHDARASQEEEEQRTLRSGWKRRLGTQPSSFVSLWTICCQCSPSWLVFRPFWITCRLITGCQAEGHTKQSLQPRTSSHSGGWNTATSASWSLGGLLKAGGGWRPQSDPQPAPDVGREDLDHRVTSPRHFQDWKSGLKLGECSVTPDQF